MSGITVQSPEASAWSTLETAWVYWLYYPDEVTGDQVLYVGSSFRETLAERIREHNYRRGPCQVVFAAQVPRAREIETAMHVVLSPYRHRVNPDSFHITLDKAYQDLLPLLHRQTGHGLLH